VSDPFTDRLARIGQRARYSRLNNDIADGCRPDRPAMTGRLRASDHDCRMTIPIDSRL
jgi:hypothetical protein